MKSLLCIGVQKTMTSRPFPGRCACLPKLTLAMLAGFALNTVSPATIAGESLSLDDQQTRSVMADNNRRESVSRARSGLGYPTFYHDADDVQRTLDFPGISEQLRRMPLPPPQQAVIVRPYNLAYPGWAGVRQLYGTTGPTIASVSHVMEQRLNAGHFYPLRLGGVEDAGSAIVVRLINNHGAVGQVLTVDKKTGLWAVSR